MTLLQATMLMLVMGAATDTSARIVLERAGEDGGRQGDWRQGGSGERLRVLLLT